MEQIREACTPAARASSAWRDRPKSAICLWKGRKNAFGAVGRVSPTYYVQDGVVPRTKIAPTLRYIGEVGQKYGLTISNIFHAGDGNMHPIILFNARKPGDLERRRQRARTSWRTASTSADRSPASTASAWRRMELMASSFTPDTLDMIGRLKALFDPDCRLNPGKVLPTGSGCLEIRQQTLTAATML